MAACLIATDLGTGRAFTEQLWPGSPRRQGAVRLALAACAVVAAGALWAVCHRMARRGGVVWGGGLAAASLLGAAPGSSVLVVPGAVGMLQVAAAARRPVPGVPGSDRAPKMIAPHDPEAVGRDGTRTGGD